MVPRERFPTGGNYHGGFYRKPDRRFLVGADWWESTRTKYNKDGTVYKRPSGPPGPFYTWLVLEPTSDRAGAIMIGFLAVMVIASYAFAIAF